MFKELILCQALTKCFSNINLFYPLNNPMGQVLVPCPFHRWGN